MHLLKFLIPFLLLGGTLPSRAQHLPIRTYTTAEGLPDDRVRRIVPDSRGFLWFCTARSLSRFDGRGFHNLVAEPGPTLNDVNSVLEMRDGTYLIGTSLGVVRFDPVVGAHHFVLLSVGNQGPSGTFYVFQDSRGRLWAGGIGGLFRLSLGEGGARFAHVDLGSVVWPSEQEVSLAICEDRHGWLWVAMDDALLLISPEGSVHRLEEKDGLPGKHVRNLHRDVEEGVWIGTTRVIARLSFESRTGTLVVHERYVAGRELPRGVVGQLFESSDRTVWVSLMGKGVVELAPDPAGRARRPRLHGTGDGLSDTTVTCFAEDSGRNVWFGTESAGAMRLARSGFSSYEEAEGLDQLRIASIFETPGGELCVTAAHTIYRLTSNRFVRTQPNVPEEAFARNWSWYQCSFQDREKEWWIPSFLGLYRFSGIRRVEDLARCRPRAVYTRRSGLSGDDVFRLYEDARGNIWIGTMSPSARCLTRWDRRTGTFSRFGPEDGLPVAAPTAFSEDRNGDLWIGFYTGGVARYRAGRFEYFSTARGCPVGLIRCLHRDPAGRLWVATSDGGVARIDHPTAPAPAFVVYTISQGLSSNLVSAVTSDLAGRIYLGTSRGVDRLHPETGSMVRFTTADGLPNNFVNVAYRDRHGDVWFGTLHGLARLTPRTGGSTGPSRVYISSVRVAGRVLPLSELGETLVAPLSLSSRGGPIEVSFFGVDFGPGESLRYQYRLDGADHGWSEPTSQRTVQYASLHPGGYRFEVRAARRPGELVATPASFAFTIPSPVWQRWWFLAIVGLLTMAAVLTIHRVRIARLLAVERVRTRLATDLHDDIGASLSRIAVLSEVARHEAPDAGAVLHDPLERIAEVSREMVDDMSDLVWSTNPDRDHLIDLVQRMRRVATDLLTSRGIDFRLNDPDTDLSRKIDPEVRRQVFLVFKEAVNNAARHSRCTRVDVSFFLERKTLVLKVTDDGVGIVTGGDGGSGMGLRSMSRRAAAVRGTLRRESSPGKGTTLTFTLPLDGARAGRRSPPA